MKKYDPHTAPVPEEWNLLDEAERIELIKRYHKKARVKLPNATLHAGIHTGVENQIAMGDETPVARTIERLLDEGLDRHDTSMPSWRTRKPRRGKMRTTRNSKP